MGDYSKLQFDCVLNDFGFDVVSILQRDKGYPSPWKGVFEKYPDHEITKAWSKVVRKNFIPFGSSAYFSTSGSSLFENKWSVSCSLKNYNQEIETFIKNVLPFMIKEGCDCYVWFYGWEERHDAYEEDDEYNVAYAEKFFVQAAFE